MTESVQQELHQFKNESINSPSAEVSMIFDDLSKTFNEITAKKKIIVKRTSEHYDIVDVLSRIDKYDFQRLIKIRSTVCPSIYDDRITREIDANVIINYLSSKSCDASVLPNIDLNIGPENNQTILKLVENLFNIIFKFLQGNHIMSKTDDCAACLKKTKISITVNDDDVITPREIAATYHFITVCLFLTEIGRELFPLDIMFKTIPYIPKAINSPMIVRMLPKGMIKEIFHLIVFIAYQNDRLIHWQNGRCKKPSTIVNNIVNAINSHSIINETMKIYFCKKFNLISNETEQWDPKLVEANAFSMNRIAHLRCINFSLAINNALSKF